MKLFEIPVYAVSKEKLEKEVAKERLKYEEKLTAEGLKQDPEHFKKCSALYCYPFDLWDYNHIIGYIVVKKEKNDIIVDQYIPVQSIQRYAWKSKNKKYLMNALLGGQHFYFGSMTTGTQLQTALHEMLNSIIDKIESKGYFVDREAYDAIDAILDYDKLLRG